jgi:hypothetical protein
MKTIKVAIAEINDPAVVIGDCQVFTSCDIGYFQRYGRQFLASINRNSPGIHVCVELINAGDGFEQIVTETRDLVRGISLSFVKTEASGPQFQGDRQKTFYSCQRFITLARLLKQRPVNTFALDVDSYVMRDLAPVFSFYRDVDFAAFFRPEKIKLSRRMMAGGLFFNTRRGNVWAFLDNLADRLRAAEARWFIDQESLVYAFRDSAPGLVAGMLKSDFLDFKFRSTSLVWTGKGNRKTAEKKYLAYGASLDRSLAARPTACLVLPFGSEGIEQLSLRHSALISRDYLAQQGIDADILQAWSADIGAVAAALPHKQIFLSGEVGAPDGRTYAFPFLDRTGATLRQRVCLVGKGTKVANINARSYAGLLDMQQAVPLAPDVLGVAGEPDVHRPWWVRISLKLKLSRLT